MSGLNRRNFLRNLGVSVGAFAAGSALAQGSTTPGKPHGVTKSASGDDLADAGSRALPTETFTPPEPLAADEMRISFMGTDYTPRIGQACNSVFVELGNGDSFIFDCGSGVTARYVAMGVPYSRMTNVFLTHLHADHMSDLVFIYCFGPSSDRKTDLHVYGPSGPRGNEGTKAFCRAMQALTKWHRESFSFLSTGLKNGQDGYKVVAHELPYKQDPGVAYDSNGVKITHFPAIHARDGSISYKLEWEGLSMVFTGDTKPNEWVLKYGKNVDVLIHEVTVSPETWTLHNGLKPGDPQWDKAVAWNKSVQDSSHTPAQALGYIFSQTQPRLAVATHFMYNDDCLTEINRDIATWYTGPLALALDLMVINVSKDKSKPIRQRMATVDNFAWYTATKTYPADEVAPPKYPSPTAQFSKFTMAHALDETVWKK
ncbi:MAG: MBL fold metallo-hydrolase [Planctomycetota bacterium]|nr:MBL fold metallo-hydrolase [Planctomycetota bacterium]